MITKKFPYYGKDVFEECENFKEVEGHKSSILTTLCFIAILFAFISFFQLLFNILHPYNISNSIIVFIKNIFLFIPEWIITFFNSAILFILIYSIVKYYSTIINDTYLFYQLIFLKAILCILELLSLYQGNNISYALMILIPIMIIYISVIMFLIGFRLNKLTKKNLFHKLGIGFIALSITKPLELILIIFFWEIATIGIILNLFFTIYTLYQIKNLFN